MNTPMNLYLVKRPDMPGYDEYDAYVVIAATPEDAVAAFPDKHHNLSGAWPVDPATLTVTRISTLAADVKPGVILASFNAG